MNNSPPLFESDVPGLTRIARGKVRDIYSVDDERLLIVTTDRLSAYDVVMPDPVPGKGQVLTELSNFWFHMMEDLIPNHLTHTALASIVEDLDAVRQLQHRSMVVRRLTPLPIEAVVRGYLIGSGWNDYRETGSVCGISLPGGLRQASRLPNTIFTPASKAEAGDHDENICFDEVVALIGEDHAVTVCDTAIRIYERAAAYALERGIIIADTKFEFGLDDEGQLFVIDEMLTPDSSRFWPSAKYAEGSSPPSFDKQYVRDYLETLDWDKTAPGPKLPAEVLKRTGDKYREALGILTGQGATANVQSPIHNDGPGN
jgi:phosphoribosylaminoimidazole-succinocarboxamide synthase